MTFMTTEEIDSFIEELDGTYQEEFATAVFKLRKVTIAEVESNMVYLSCDECSSLVWNDCIYEVVKKLNIKNNWICDDPGTLYLYNENVEHDRKLMAEAKKIVENANELYAQLCDRMKEKGYLIMPESWASSEFGDESQRHEWLANAAEDQLAGKYGPYIADAYADALESL